jgi:sulfide:quinone oxidoreductase
MSARILVAGGGPAAVEGVLALRHLWSEARIELVAPVDEFVYRPLAIAEAFGDDPPQRFDLTEIAAAAGASLRHDAVTAVEHEARAAITAAGERLEFDAMMIAIGARPVEALAGTTTFWGDGGDPAFVRELRALERGTNAELVFAVPHRVRWGLPLYELALQTADHLAEHGVAARLTIVTPEPEPLAVFSGDVSKELERMLKERGIGLRLSTDPVKYLAGARGTRVIALPRLVGPGLPDLPVDDHGFLPTDDYGRVLDAPGFYAAGDVTDSPIKQGGLGTQQADAAASVIAADLGAGVEPEPFAPVLRGRVFTEGEPRFLRRDLATGRGSEFDRAPLWWPGAKIFGRHLAPFLAQLSRR